METAMQAMQRINLRHRRAMSLTSAVLKEIEPFLDYEYRRRDIYDAIFHLFSQEGVDVLTDYDRQQHGLPPRGPDGWTVEEMMALEQRRLELLTNPPAPVFIRTETAQKQPKPTETSVNETGANRA